MVVRTRSRSLGGDVMLSAYAAAVPCTSDCLMGALRSQKPWILASVDCPRCRNCTGGQVRGSRKFNSVRAGTSWREKRKAMIFPPSLKLPPPPRYGGQAGGQVGERRYKKEAGLKGRPRIPHPGSRIPDYSISSLVNASSGSTKYS